MFLWVFIYVMSEDSDLYDSNMEVDYDYSKVFKLVERFVKLKGFVCLFLF